MLQAIAVKTTVKTNQVLTKVVTGTAIIKIEIFLSINLKSKSIDFLRNKSSQK